MLQWVLNLLSGPAIKGAIEAYKLKLESGNNTDRIAADLAARELELEARTRELQTQLMIAEQGRWWTAIIRPLIAMPVIIYLWAIIVWDKVLGMGTTDPLTGQVADWAGIIITTYVGGRSIEKAAALFKRR
jgi:hypothetical protein